MATITKGGSGLTLATGGNWVGGIAPGASDVARWVSTSSSGSHTGTLTILGLQIDGALGDVLHTSGTLTLTQTDAFTNGTSNNRRWTQQSTGVMALGSGNKNFTLVHTAGGYCIDFNATGALTGSGIVSFINGLANSNYNNAYFGVSFPLAGFTGTIRLTDGTGIFSGATATGIFTAGNITVDGPNCILSVGVTNANIGAAGRTLTINDSVTLGRNAYTMNIPSNVALGSVTRTLTVAGNTTMSGTVTGSAGVTVTIQNSSGRPGSATTNYFYLTGSSSGLTGACTVSGGRFVVGPSTTATRYQPSSINVASDATFDYFPMSNTDFTFPCAPTGTGFISIYGNHTAGGGVTFNAGQLTSFAGIVRAGCDPTSGFQSSRVRLSELPAGLDWWPAPTTSAAIAAEITYVGGAATYSSNLTVDNYSNTSLAGLTGGTYSLLSSGTGPITITGTVQRLNTAGTASARMSLTLGGSNTGDNTLSGDISEPGSNSASLGIAKVDAGRWVLSGANSSHTGPHAISAGTLAAQSAKALGGATATEGVTVSGTGVLELGDGVTLNKSFTDFTLSNASNPVQTAGTSTLQTKAISLSATPTFTVASGRKLTIAPQNAGVISGAFGITKAGAGELELTANANTYTGTVTVSAGTLTIGSVANAGAAAAWGTGSLSPIVEVTGTLKYTGATASSSRTVRANGSAPTLDASGTGALTLTSLSQDTTAKTITLTGSNTDANTLSSNIANNTGAVGIAKAGVGKWVLSGALSYTGTTAVAGTGTLRVETTNSNTTSGAVTIASGSTVELVTDTLASTSSSSGEVLGTSNVTVNGGSIKTRGGTTQKGQVRYGGNLTFGAGSTLYIGAAA